MNNKNDGGWKRSFLLFYSKSIAYKQLRPYLNENYTQKRHQ